MLKEGGSYVVPEVLKHDTSGIFCQYICPSELLVETIPF